MKHLLTVLSCLLLTFSVGYGQIWTDIGPVGTPIASSVGEMEFVVTPQGVPYVFYVNSGGGAGTVKYWNGSNWMTVGTVGFTETNIYNLRLEVYEDTVYVAYYVVLGTDDHIKVKKFNGSAWEDLSSYIGQGVLLTNHARPYDFNVSPTGEVQLAFFENFWANNWIYCIYNGSYFDDPYNTMPSGNVFAIQIETDTLGNDWLMVGKNLNTKPYVRSGNSWNPQGEMFYSSVQADQLDMDIFYDNSGTNTYLSSSLVETNGTVSYQNEFDYASASFNNPTGPIVFGSNPISYLDIASSKDSTWIFATNGTSIKFGYKQHSNLSFNNVMFPSTGGTILCTQVELKQNADPVVAYVDNGSLYVKELWTPVSYNVQPNLEVCSGITQNITDVLELQSENIDNSDISIAITPSSTNITVANLVTSAFPFYNLNISTLPIYNTSESYLLEITVSNETGSTDATSQEPILVKFVDSIVNSYTGFAVCDNAGLIDFKNYLYPMGGTFTGDISSTGILNTAVAPNPVTFYYSTTSSAGCIAQQPIGLNVNEAPTAAVSVTSSGCNDSTGTASVIANNGVGPYTYYWTTGADSTNLSGLPAGQYFVTVTDNNGCMATGVANIGNSSVNLMATPTMLNCPDDNNGAIDLTVAGTGPFDILWSNGYATEDITGLSAGTYDVTVEDANGCIATETYEIMAPTEISATAVATNANCGSADGAISVSASGGTGTLSYQWYDAGDNAIGTNSNTISSLPGGYYYCEITDGNGCSMIISKTINENGAPTISLNQSTSAGCTNNGALDISITGTPTSINWSNGATSEDITNLPPGNYTVSVTDGSGCSSIETFQVNQAVPATPEICVVTVDSATTRNLVIWEKPVTTEISHYNIYREGSVAGVYSRVDSVLYSEDSEYLDYVASPMVRSWRYKISAVNNCGVESLPSPYHKTIHTTINLGLGSNINLIWDAYEGLTYSTINCYRNTDVNGYELLWVNPSSIFSFTDTPPSMVDLDYVIGFDLAAPCTSSLMKAQDYNGTRSNRSAGVFNGSGLGLDDQNITDFAVSLFPNPNNGQFRIHITGVANGSFDYSLMDMTGKVVKKGSQVHRVFDMDLTELEKGVYFMNIENNGVVETKKIVLQ